MHRYPPGHGDVFPSLLNSGKLDALLSQVDPRAQLVFSWNVFIYLFFIIIIITIFLSFRELVEGEVNKYMTEC